MAGVLTLGLLAGCVRSTSGTGSTDGSTSMEKVIGVLGETFESENASITFTFNPTGSGSGIQAVQEGRCDIGLSSRTLKDEEKESGLTETVLAYDGIAVVVHPGNPVSDLDVDTIAKVYTGEITNWEDMGDSVKALSVGGIAPSTETVKDGSYAIQRPFVLVTKADAKLSDTAQKFFDFALAPKNGALITKAGVVPAN